MKKEAKENNLSDKESSSSGLEYHEKEFWDNFYKNRNPNMNNINWYFDITKINIDNFSLNNLSKEDDILLVGPGLSSILDYFNNNGYEKITIFDYSEELVKILAEKYNKEWMIDSYDILEINDSVAGNYNIIIDKGCLDCIISEPKNGQNRFIKAFNNLMLLLNDDGIFYYFSTAKDRENLFQLGTKIKYEITKIDVNQIMENDYKQFKMEDNIYYLYSIKKSEESIL